MSLRSKPLQLILYRDSASALEAAARRASRPRRHLFNAYLMRTMSRFVDQRADFLMNVSTSNLVSSEMIPSTPIAAACSILRGSLTVQVITVFPAA